VVSTKKKVDHQLIATTVQVVIINITTAVLAVAVVRFDFLFLCLFVRFICYIYVTVVEA
jgi:hypothetical protein